MKPIYVLIDVKTGTFWKKQTRGIRRGVYAYKSEAKALATLKQMDIDLNDVKIQKYETTEHNS